MSEQARKVKYEAIPEWAQGLYYNKGLFSEVLVYYDEEALYFECRGNDVHRSAWKVNSPKFAGTAF